MSFSNYELYSDLVLGVDRSRIDNDAIKIISRLQKSGFAAFLVGGSIRDLLLRKSPKDFDIATDARPNQVKKLFRNCRIIGKRFKLAHIFFANQKIIEVATFRTETNSNESDEVEILARDNAYGSMGTDSLRRDITINGLFYDPLQGVIIDYVGGVDDMRKGLIKIIGDPDKRFTEDPVRIIRAIRQQARTGFKIERKTLQSLKGKIKLILECPSSRIYEEFKKDLSSGYFQEIIQLLEQEEILPLIMPELSTQIKQTLKMKDFLFCLKGLDRFALEGKAAPATTGLTILALFSLPEFELYRSLPECFGKQNILQDKIGKIFGALQVSKKEKHIIKTLLRAIWIAEFAHQRNRTIATRPRTFEYQQEISQLLNIININNSRAHLKKYIKF